MKAEFSCKNCTERHPGCHGSCESYLAAKKRNEVEKEKYNNFMAKQYLFDDYYLKKQGRRIKTV